MCYVYSSEPVSILSDKQNISTKQSAYQNIYFILHPYVIQNKYVPPTIKSRPSGAGTPQFENLCSI
jgi:hypothetical protein